jgi:hypothetical protein
MKLDIQVRTSPSLVVQSSIAQNLQANADLRIRGTPSQPGVLGRVSISEGPAVGFRLRQDQGNRIFYVPDVALIVNCTQVFSHAAIYIGDGAAIHRPILRKRGDVVIGHASMAAQLKRCREAQVAQVIFTHWRVPNRGKRRTEGVS